MLVSLNWLKNYVDIGNITPEDLAEKITKSGIEVDGIEYVGEKSSDVVVGYVESCEKHPNADKLNLCQVDVGEEKLQIVCGAANVAAGKKVAVAKPGAKLPGNIKIKRVTLRGVESNGMICSLQELGMDDKHIPKEFAEGIFIFPDDVQVGEPVEPLLNLHDAVLEFDLTPNRADCLNMIGVAYEVAAILDKPLTLPEITIETETEKTADYVSVEVEAKDLNPYYGAFIIKDVEIKPSPLWMQNYLIAAGIRPINNVVDITNYVLLEYGQPLHAFDYDRLNSNKIVVRRAYNHEKMVTLDDVERTLSEKNLVITNGSIPVALAGVMGGANTEVHDGTTTILLEAAYFDAASTRQTVKETGLRSEASTRYEKGMIDLSRIKEAGRRACQLIQQYANGKVLDGVVEIDALDRSEKTVAITTSQINNRLGTAITSDEIAHILTKLRFSFDQEDEAFTVHVPTRRRDITLFEDMLEEVARIYGYDALPFTLPSGVSQAGALTEHQQVKRNVKQFLQGVGLTEVITYSLTNKAFTSKLISPDLQEINLHPVQIAMPMSEDHSYLRVSILPELLKTVSYNLARNQSSLAYYELGTIFISEEENVTKQPHEQLRLAGALTGIWMENLWQQEKKQVDFYVVKGILEGLFEHFDIQVKFEQAQLADMHPGRCAIIVVNGKQAGFLGQLHPRLEKAMDLKETYVFDVNLEVVLDAYNPIPAYRQIPKYPSITRDVAFVLNEGVKAGEVRELIEKEGTPLVKQVHVFDVYHGDNLPQGKKSIAFNLVYQDPEKTLKDEEVEASFKKIIQTVNDTYDAYIRS